MNDMFFVVSETSIAEERLSLSLIVSCRFFMIVRWRERVEQPCTMMMMSINSGTSAPFLSLAVTQMSEAEREASAPLESAITVLLARCEERGRKQAALADATRRAHFAVSAARMALFATQGSAVEFADCVDVAAPRVATVLVAPESSGALAVRSAGGDDTVAAGAARDCMLPAHVADDVRAAFVDVVAKALDMACT